MRFAILPLLAASALSACAATTATVVSSSGPSISAAQAEPSNGQKLRIAVQPFDAGTQGHSVGAGMADMLTDALFNTNRFIVVERDRLNDVMAEQDLGDSGRFRRDTVAAKGQLEGAQLIVRASVTTFEKNCSGGSIILASAKEACIAINLRILDTTTGRVVNATTVEATSASRGIGLIYTHSNLPIGLGAYANTPVEKAIRNAIEAAVNHIASTKL
jgi:curli biogenesis system outer membrane secretion channel CsgG